MDHSGDSPLNGASSVRVRDGSLQPLVQRHVRAVNVAYFSVILARTHAESFVSLSALITSVVVMICFWDPSLCDHNAWEFPKRDLMWTHRSAGNITCRVLG